MVDLIGEVRNVQGEIDSETNSGLNSDVVLQRLRPGLEALGYAVERGKRKNQKVLRPVLFGESGEPRVTYEVDAFHEDLGIVIEVEAGRGALGNAIYRDIVRAALIVDARYLVLGVMKEYRYKSSGRAVSSASYEAARNQFDAIYASGRLNLPYEGVLLFGY